MKIPEIKTKEEQKPSRLLAIALIVVIMLFILSTAITTNTAVNTVT